LRQANYQKMILVLSHMRSGSTALCNVLCSHPQMSGYGETHVNYGDGFGPGRVILNLVRYRAFDARAPFVVDKVLHNNLDTFPQKTFKQARAIFLLRSPGPAIASVVSMAKTTKMTGVRTSEGAAAYYLKRLERMQALWAGFLPGQRLGMTTEKMFAHPDETLSAVGRWLTLSSPLQNAYRPNPASTLAGAGDPIFSGRARSIEVRQHTEAKNSLDGLPPNLRMRCEKAHAEMLKCFDAR